MEVEAALVEEPQMMQADPRWQDPLPEEWKLGRATRAEAWFQAARDDAARRHTAQQLALIEARKAQQELEAQQSALQKKQAAHSKVQCLHKNASNAIVQDAKAAATVRQAPLEHSIRWPHHIAARPVLLLDCQDDGVPLQQQVFVRGLASSLLGNAQAASDQADVASASLQGFRDLLRPGCAGTDMLWWGPIQPHGTGDDAQLARLEALQACCTCIVLLSANLLNSPSWDAERQVLAARMLNQQDVGRPLWLVVLRYADSNLALPPPLDLPQLPGDVQSVTQITQVDIPFNASYEEQLNVALAVMQPALNMAGVTLPPAPALTLHFSPAAAVQAAAAAGILSDPGSKIRNARARLGCTATHGAGDVGVAWASVGQTTTHAAGSQDTLDRGFQRGALSGPLDTGAACVVAHGMPFPLGNTKPLTEWTVQDVSVWLCSHGTALAALAPALQRYGVDGALLPHLQPEHFKQLGLVHQPALPLLADVIKGLQSRSGLAAGLSGSQLLVTGRSGLAPGADDPLLITSSDQELEQVFMEVFRYYDKDCSDDLCAEEVQDLLCCSGINLAGTEVTQVINDYDADGDGKLCAAEARHMLWDVLRLLIASRDCTAWNVPSAQADGRSRRCTLTDEASQRSTDTGCGSLAVPKPGMLKPAHIKDQAAPDTLRLTKANLNAASHSKASSVHTAHTSRVCFATAQRKLLGQPPASPSEAATAHQTTQLTRDSHAPTAKQAAKGGRAGPGSCVSGGKPGSEWLTRSEDGISTAAPTVATDLEVFSDPALIDAKHLRSTCEPNRLTDALLSTLTAADLQRRHSLSRRAVRSALAAGLANDTILAGGGLSLSHTLGAQGTSYTDGLLSPAELRLLATHILDSCSYDPDEPVSITDYVSAAAEAVAVSEKLLLDQVYSAGGSQRLLYRLHAQVYPQSLGTIEGLRVAAAKTTDSAVASLDSSALASTKVPFGDAPQLLDVLITQGGMPVPYLVRAALLQEAAAAAERSVGNEVEVWSYTAAHVLYVWKQLLVLQQDDSRMA